MRIAMVSGSYPGMDCGVGDYTRNLASAIRARGHEIAVLTRRDHRILAGDGPPVLGVAAQWGPLGVLTLLSRLRSFGPDVVHLQYGTIAFDEKASICLLPAACRTALPQARMVTTVHTPKGPYWFPRAGRWRDRLFGLLAGGSDTVITTTNGQAGQIARLTGVDKHAAVVPVGPGILPRRRNGGRRAEFRRRIGVGPHDMMFVTFGVIHPDHDYRSLLEGFKQALTARGNVKLLLIGGGGRGAGTQTRDWVARQLRGMGLERTVRLTGYLPEETAREYLAVADAAIQVYGGGVSDARSSFATVAAFGLPVITTSGTDQPDAVRSGGNALLVPPGDPAAMAAAIAALAGSAALRASLGRGAAALSARYSWDAIAAATERIYGDRP
ncbi:MAG: glycosyltransferase family 4 protein [Candidatus Edwardsbacteria bacterium]|nr:glycosyltransferase family 4 protein [Candidatus Edwardsbacteria bacterium]